MRYPFAISQAAARASADRPVRKAATRPGAAILSDVSGGKTLSVFAIAIPHMVLPGKLERARIDFSARPAGYVDGMGDRILDAALLQCRSQQLVEIALGHDAGTRRGWADHQDKLAARLQCAV